MYVEDGNLPDELKAIVLEEEIKDLRNALKNEKSRNARLQKVIEQRRLVPEHSQSLHIL